MKPYLSQKIKILSLLAMLMVVLVHAYNHSERYLHPATMVTDGMTFNRFAQLLIANGLTRWAIPLFFLISGYLNFPHPDRSWQSTAKKRLRTLLIPYLIWSALGLLLYWCVQHNTFLWEATLAAQLGPFETLKIEDYSIGQLLGRWLFVPLPFQLWFLRCLLVYSLAVPLFLAGLKRFAPVLWVLFGLMWFFNIGLYFIEGEGLLFFTLGLWLKMREKDLQQPPAWFQFNWFALGWVALLGVKTTLAFGSYDSILPLVQMVLYRLSQPLAVLVIWFGYDAWMKGRLPNQIWVQLAAFTFIIYGFHVPLLHILMNGAILLWGDQDLTLWWIYLGSSMAAILICIGLGGIVKYLAPAAFGVLTGGRGL